MSAPGRTGTGPVMTDSAAGRKAGGARRQAAGGPGRGAPGEPGPGMITEKAALELLSEGELEVVGQLVDASNTTLFCTVSHAGQQAACVYKPVAGERPLWDFPAGTLAGREVAAYLVSHAAGWDVAPPTVHRAGPFGPGMCQLWIDADESVDLLALARRTDHTGLREMAVFDAVVNNADRKVGHLLPAPGGHLYGCDHGVCFGEEYKLRTVLWQWRGARLTKRSLAALARLKQALEYEGLAADLGRWLTEEEVTATRRRVDDLLERKVHPYPSQDWPAVPWPPI
jgi:hypothetical protein